MGALRKNPITVISLTSGHDSSPKKKSQLVGDSRISESQIFNLSTLSFF
jgi:hypothetical protein